ncbi:hypothetical protein IPL85_01015 [Candidatus Saccharibacteria bacterium]|nr:MAG: hypothetical protein IPL85_01015 [Candidatus Saccharibacteria bacterium]
MFKRSPESRQKAGPNREGVPPLVVDEDTKIFFWNQDRLRKIYQLGTPTQPFGVDERRLRALFEVAKSPEFSDKVDVYCDPTRLREDSKGNPYFTVKVTAIEPDPKVAGITHGFLHAVNVLYLDTLPPEERDKVLAEIQQGDYTNAGLVIGDAFNSMGHPTSHIAKVAA